MRLTAHPRARLGALLLAALCLVAGYADLARGGITAAPILLILAYFVFIPAAILAGPRAEHYADDALTDHRPEYLAAAIAGAVIFVLYVITLAPSTAMWDTSEYITAAYTLGLPHPPGNPLFVLIGRVFAILPVAPSVAMRVNVLAAVSSAAAAAMWFLITERILSSFVAERWQRLAGASLAVLVGGTAFTVWNQSVVNEKVYTVSLLGIAIISWLMVRWVERPDGSRADHILVLVAYLLGLGYANHMAGMLPGPAVALAVLVRRPRTVLRWKLLLACAALIVVGLTPFATQPIRAAYVPPLNEGEPTACRTGIALSCTFSHGTWEAFKYNINREQYGKPALSVRQAPPEGQVGMWWQYFRWQWLRDPSNTRGPVQFGLAVVFLGIALFGGWIHFRRQRRTFWYVGGLIFLTTLALIYYLNFKYGATQAPELGNNVDREVRDRDYFYLWGFSALGIWLAVGLTTIWRSLSVAVARVLHRDDEADRLSWLVGAIPVGVLALVPLFGNWAAASRAGDFTTIAAARDLLNSVEPYGVLVTGGDNDTFPLWYAQEVEGVRKDVTVAVLSLLNTDWYARGIIRRPIYEYDAARGPAIYRGRSWPKPTTPAIRFTMGQADSLPPYMVLQQPGAMTKGDLHVVVDPRNLPRTPDGGALDRADLLVLHMISAGWPERPIYISRTTGSYPTRLGLNDLVLSQGLARKVFVPPKTSSPDTVYVPGDGWLDVGRTHALWRDVFVGPRAMAARKLWVDEPSSSMAGMYIFAGGELTAVLRSQGKTAAADTVRSQLVPIARLIGREQMLWMFDR